MTARPGGGAKLVDSRRGKHEPQRLELDPKSPSDYPRTVIDAESLLWVATDAAPLIVLIRGYRQRMLGLYPIFYAFIAAFLICSGAKSVLFFGWGQGSDAYYYVYYGSALLYPPFQVAILWQARQRLPCKSNFNRYDYIAGLLVVAVVALRIYSRMFEHYYSVLFTILTLLIPFVVGYFVMLARAILRVRKDLYLGRNLKGILLGVGVMTIPTAINYERIYLLNDRELYVFLLTFSVFCAHAIWAYSLWDREIPRLRSLHKPG